VKVFNTVLGSRTTNLGDEIQTIAALQYAVQDATVIDKDNPAILDGGRLLCTGWITHKPWNWPPLGQYSSLVTSIHLATRAHRPRFLSRMSNDWFYKEPMYNWLKQNEPIGARDTATLKILQRGNIDAYLSRCLTLTLARPNVEVEDNLIVLVDVDESIATKIKNAKQGRVVEYSHEVDASTSQEERMQLARKSLDMLARADFVITTRLHAALPSAAFGSKVVLINHGTDEERTRKTDFEDVVKALQLKPNLDVLNEIFLNDYSQFKKNAEIESSRIRKLFFHNMQTKSLSDDSNQVHYSRSINKIKHTLRRFRGGREYGS
jgi:hypothetical protein